MVANRVTVRKALEYVSRHPEPSTEDMIDQPMWELTGRMLFWIANNPDDNVRGSMRRATRAQKIILDRLVGTRRPGSHPAVRGTDLVEFIDLTAGVLE